MKRHGNLLFWISATVVAVIGIVVVITPGSVATITDDVRRLLSGVDGNAMLAKLIVTAKPTLPAEGRRKLEMHDWTNHPGMPIPTDEQPAYIGLILWRQQLEEMGHGNVNRYAVVPRAPLGAAELLAMTNESYKMVGVQVTPKVAALSSGASVGSPPKTHTQPRERRPLSPDQLKAIHASKRQ